MRRLGPRRLQGSSGPPEFAAETPASSSGPFGFLLRFLRILPLHHQAAGRSLVAPPTLAFLSPFVPSLAYHQPLSHQCIILEEVEVC